MAKHRNTVHCTCVHIDNSQSM